MDRPPLAHALLLADPSPCLRSRVLRELFGKSERDVEVRELERRKRGDPGVAALLDSAQRHDPGRSESIALGVELIRMGYFGFDGAEPAVSRRVDRLFALQKSDGSWPLPHTTEAGGETEPPEGRPEHRRERSPDRRARPDAIPLQTAIPLRGLAMCGYAEDPRAEKAYQWLSAMRLEDGAWPTGFASGVYRGVGGYRRLPHSRWGCRSNTTGVLLSLAHHPARRVSPEARGGLDHLLARETRDRAALGTEVARLVGAEPYRGLLTFYAAFDAALLLELCARFEASLEDERVRGLVDFVNGLRGAAGLWDHPSAKSASRWLSFDLERSIRRIPRASDWLAVGPRTAFAAYPRRPRRA